MKDYKQTSCFHQEVKMSVVILMAIAMGLCVCMACDALAESTIGGDTDGDWDVDLFDLVTIASHWLDTGCKEPGWCGGADFNHNRRVGIDDFAALAENWLKVEKADLAVTQFNNYPTRLDIGPDGKIYVTDAKTGTVFIYDSNIADPNATAVGEFKGVDDPLGIAIANDGRIFVGSKGTNSIEVFTRYGMKLASIGNGRIRLPNDIALDSNGNVYALDSVSCTVRVYNQSGRWLRNIGEEGTGNGFLEFPTCVLIAQRDTGGDAMTTEIFVGDQKPGMIQVFDLQGNYLRSFGGKPEKAGWFNPTWEWQGKFQRLQSLAMDSQGRLHAADCYMNKVQIINPATGSYISSYGDAGTDPGQLSLPLDIAIDSNGQVIVANSENKRVEVIYTIP